jgi:hypothetical protein
MRPAKHRGGAAEEGGVAVSNEAARRRAKTRLTVTNMQFRAIAAVTQ